MTRLLRFDADRFEVRFSHAALSSFEAHRQTRFFHREAGGQLFGVVEEERWAVEFASGPKTSNRRSRFGFRPNRAGEQAEINAFHAQGYSYLGDWHTHPEDVPVPSLTDQDTIREIVQQSRHELSGFLLCIVGRSGLPEGLWVSFHTRSGKMIRCSPVEGAGVHSSDRVWPTC